MRYAPISTTCFMHDTWDFAWSREGAGSSRRQTESASAVRMLRYPRRELCTGYSPLSLFVGSWERRSRIIRTRENDMPLGRQEWWSAVSSLPPGSLGDFVRFAVVSRFHLMHRKALGYGTMCEGHIFLNATWDNDATDLRFDNQTDHSFRRRWLVTGFVRRSTSPTSLSY